MISINGKQIYTSKFPDGTYQIKAGMFADPEIRWAYENDGELFQLQCIKDKLDEIGMCNATLVMPYVPNGRMDKAHDPFECTTLDTLVKIINKMEFKRVYILDPHSVKSRAFSRCVCMSILPYISWAADRFVSTCGSPELAFFFPDEGARKRYVGDLLHCPESMKHTPYTWGIKTRNYNARTVDKVEIQNKDAIKDRNVLIIDDICSKGSTFIRAYESLKEAGAKNVGLYVTHCEDNIYNGNVLQHMSVFTTNSLKRRPRDSGYQNGPNPAWGCFDKQNGQEYYNGAYGTSLYSTDIPGPNELTMPSLEFIYKEVAAYWSETNERPTDN